MNNGICANIYTFLLFGVCFQPKLKWKRGTPETLVLAGSSFVLQMRRTYDFNKVTTHTITLKNVVTV